MASFQSKNVIMNLYTSVLGCKYQPVCGIGKKYCHSVKNLRAFIVKPFGSAVLYEKKYRLIPCGHPKSCTAW